MVYHSPKYKELQREEREAGLERLKNIKITTNPNTPPLYLDKATSIDVNDGLSWEERSTRDWPLGVPPRVISAPSEEDLRPSRQRKTKN